MMRDKGGGSPLRIAGKNIILYGLVGYLYLHITIFQHHTSLTSFNHHGQQQQNFQQPPHYRHFGNEKFTMSGHPGGAGGAADFVKQITSPQEAILQKRVQRLENKLDSFLAFDKDPFLSSKTPVRCRNQTKLKEYCKALHGPTHAKDCHLGMMICLDDFPPAIIANDAETTTTTTTTTTKKNCIVYDFGIRAQPDFGVILSRPPFDCQVFAFDPSPITKKWYSSAETQKKFGLDKNPNYHLYHYGGGAADETITLREYDWDQVSIYHYPNRVLDPTNCTRSGQCRYHHFKQKELKLPVRSVESIMKELGHDHLDILKLDVEGSEYRMVEALITSGICRRINQLTLEWHHYDFDLRYGVSSLPHLNVIYTMLKTECGLEQFWIHDAVGWPSNLKIYSEMNLVLRYNLAAFRRIPKIEQQTKSSSKNKNNMMVSSSSNGNQFFITPQEKKTLRGATT